MVSKGDIVNAKYSSFMVDNIGSTVADQLVFLTFHPQNAL